ncbi:MAG: hypothetical protein R3F43_25305 [bacterium]
MPGEPSEEACNGADDDRDGRADEDFAVGLACQCGVACAVGGRDGLPGRARWSARRRRARGPSRCATASTMTATARWTSRCRATRARGDAGSGPAAGRAPATGGCGGGGCGAEACNGEDDCDGAVDEGGRCQCAGEQVPCWQGWAPDVGICPAGTRPAAPTTSSGPARVRKASRRAMAATRTGDGGVDERLDRTAAATWGGARRASSAAGGRHGGLRGRELTPRRGLQRRRTTTVTGAPTRT